MIPTPEVMNTLTRAMQRPLRPHHRRMLDVILACLFDLQRTDVHGRTFKRQVAKFGVESMARHADSWNIPRYTA